MSNATKLLKKVFPPMLATLVTEAPEDREQWTYELKYDGFRAVCALTDGELAMWSRNELDLEPRFPRIAEALRKLKVPEVVLDGEIVALDAAGVPRFQLLQSGEHREVLFVFDVIWYDGHDLRKLPYVERRKVLEKILKRAPAAIEVSQTLDETAKAALEKVKKAGMEGIIAKHNSSIYDGRRSKEWLKVKALNEQELAIIGFNPSTASTKEIGALHLAYVGDDGEFRYAGKVGTGFSAKLRTSLRDELAKSAIAKSVAADAPRVRDAIWVKPRLVAQVAFTEWTHDNKLRHPSFLGLRDDKKPEEVVRERAQKTKKVTPASSRLERRPPAGKITVNLSHPERVLYPRDKITKEDLADYYAAVAKPMINVLHNRPLALEHWNEGIDRPSWFHQNIDASGRGGAPEWVTTVKTPTRTTKHKTVDHLVIDRPETLRWLAQMSVLTTHMWSSHVPTIDSPDWIVFDLDPAKGKGIEQAIEAAIIMRRVLENLKVPSVPKTSGKRGIHVFVPLAPGYTHEEANEWACSVGAAVAANVPDFTVERSLAKRRGRLYLDCMQNGYGKTVVAPYSPRAMDGAPVSAPLKWEEITKKLDPLKFNIHTMPDRLAKMGDLFAPALKKGVKLPELR
jgi:bifunctional non-homologous end joining protein LigD